VVRREERGGVREGRKGGGGRKGRGGGRRKGREGWGRGGRFVAPFFIKLGLDGSEHLQHGQQNWYEHG